MDSCPCVLFAFSHPAVKFLEGHFGSLEAFDCAFENYQVPVQVFFNRHHNPIHLALITPFEDPVGLIFIKSAESWLLEEAFSISNSNQSAQLSA